MLFPDKHVQVLPNLRSPRVPERFLWAPSVIVPAMEVRTEENKKNEFASK